RGRESKTTVKVLADPRSRNGAADWQRRWEAITRAGAVQGAAGDAIQLIARVRADVEAAVAKEAVATERAKDETPAAAGAAGTAGAGATGATGAADEKAGKPVAQGAEDLGKRVAGLG